MGNIKTMQSRHKSNTIYFEGFFTIEQITEITIYNGSCNKIKISQKYPTRLMAGNKSYITYNKQIQLEPAIKIN